jgi:hypothetical protein
MPSESISTFQISQALALLKEGKLMCRTVEESGGWMKLLYEDLIIQHIISITYLPMYITT